MILVTGGTGLVGAHLLLQLVESDNEIRAIYRNSKTIEKTRSLFLLHQKEIPFEKIEWIKADITDIPSLEIAFKNVDYVYHCAALISFNPKEENLLRKINIEGTANIVNFCIAYNVQKICFVSSVAALGDLKENETVITEETEWNPEKPHSDYAISKYGAEMEIWRGQQEGINTIIVNPGIIIGSLIWKNGSGKIIKNIEKGFPFYTKGKTGFVAVTDVATIMILLMKSELKSERYTLIAENIVFKNLFVSIAKILKVKKPSIYLSPFLINLLWRIDWVFSVIFRNKRRLDRATAMASYSKNVYSNEKIKKALDYEFIGIIPFIKSISKS
jgi:dihydroflavonol-4-reductase